MSRAAGPLLLAIRRDWAALTSGGAGLLALAVVPLALLLTVQADSAEQPARVLVVGDKPAESRARLVTVMNESSQVTVEARDQEIVDPLAVIAAERWDILVDYGSRTSRPAMYSAETDPQRLAELERIAAGIARLDALIEQRLTAGKATAELELLTRHVATLDADIGDYMTTVVKRAKRQPLFADVWWARRSFYEDLFMLGTLPVHPLSEYYPQAADPRAAMLPPALTLMLSLLPFALAAGLACEPRSARPPVFNAWRENAWSVAGAAVVPAGAAIAALLAMLLLAELVLGVQIKAGALRMVLVALPAVAATAWIGRAIVRLARGRVQLAMASLLYVTAVGLLVGSTATLLQRHGAVRLVAQLLPATHLQGVLDSWLFGAPFTLAALPPVGWLVGLAAGCWGLALAAERHAAAQGSVLPEMAATVTDAPIWEAVAAPETTTPAAAATQIAAP